MSNFTGDKGKKNAIGSIVVLIAALVVICTAVLLTDYNDDRDRVETERNALMAHGYSDATISKERTTCPNGVYGKWYNATNAEGKHERGVLCITYPGDVPYLIPSFSKD